MTTHANSTRIKHNSDEAFREWLNEFSDSLDAIGLVQTSDTGQINLATVTRPGSNTLAGYQIRRFDDSLQATAPIFIRFDFGTGGSATSPEIQVSVGTGTNGAGTLTQTGIAGTMTTAREISASDTGGSGQTSEVARPSHYCHAEGFFGVSWKNSTTAVIGLPGLVAICRTCNSSGEPDGRGILIDWGGGSTQQTRQSVAFTGTPQAFTAQTSNPNNMLGFLPAAPIATVVEGANQVALAWAITPLSEPLFGMVGVYPTEVPGGCTFRATPVGTTPRTFISVNAWVFGIPTSMRVAMLWE